MEKRFDIIHEFYTNFFTAKTNLMKTSQRLIEPMGVSFASWQLIAHISVFTETNHRGMTTAELAGDLLISRQAVLKQLKCLMEEQLILIQENENDKRSPYYCLSDKGNEWCEHMVKEIYGDWMLESMKDFSLAEIKAATNILIRLTKFKYYVD